MPNTSTPRPWTSSFTVTAAVVAVVLSPPLAITSARADFSKVSVELHDDTCAMDTWRVYVDFTNPTDQLLGVNSVQHPLVFQSTADLFNDGGQIAGLYQEDLAAAPITGPRDSWVTIGSDQIAGNPARFSPGFAGGDGVHNVIRGTSFVEDNGGWHDAAPLTPANGGRILIAQFTLPMGAAFTFEGTVTWLPAPSDLRDTIFQVEATTTPCTGDVDRDALVGNQDLIRVLAAWGLCGECCPEDMDIDGRVDLNDLLTVIGAWGSCPRP